MPPAAVLACVDVVGPSHQDLVRLLSSGTCVAPLSSNGAYMGMGVNPQPPEIMEPHHVRNPRVIQEESKNKTCFWIVMAKGPIFQGGGGCARAHCLPSHLPQRSART